MNSKSPISILQEFMVKRMKPIPTYEDINHQNVGLNNHLFTVRVKSGELSAEGKGSTKKDAKTNAAREMLLKIGGAKPTDDPLALNSNPTLNYIGLLHEHCTQKAITAPKFVEVNSYGQPHMMNFTIRCQVAEIIEEATATTKKEAKTEAAKKVWFKISKMRFDPPINKTIDQKFEQIAVEIIDLKLDEVLPDYSEHHQAAEDKYLKLKKLKPCVFINGEENMIQNYHNLIASRSSLFLRERIISQLSQITEAQEDINLLPIYKSIIENVARCMGVKLHRLMLQHKKSIREFMISYRLDTYPPIVNICSAETERLADYKTIVSIAKDVQILLS